MSVSGYISYLPSEGVVLGSIYRSPDTLGGYLESLVDPGLGQLMLFSCVGFDSVLTILLGCNCFVDGSFASTCMQPVRI